MITCVIIFLCDYNVKNDNWFVLGEQFYGLLYFKNLNISKIGLRSEILYNLTSISVHRINHNFEMIRI